MRAAHAGRTSSSLQASSSLLEWSKPEGRTAIGVSNQASLQSFANDATLLRLTPKLAIGAVDDPLERDADRVAAQVMRMADPRAPSAASGPPKLQRKCSSCEEEDKERPVLRKADAPSATMSVAPPSVNAALSSVGAPLDRASRDYFEPRFGRDFSKVRVHNDAQASVSAAEVGALAYTVGAHVVLANGQSVANRALMAHELAHVIQQQGGLEPIHLRRQPGPGAGPCRQTARWPGNMEHALIEDDYVTNVNPGAGAIEYLIPGSGPNGGTGYADMVDTAGYKIYEIKTFVGAPQGVIEAARYAAEAQVNCPPPIPRMWAIGNDYPAHTIPFSPTQELVVQQYPQFPGVVVYYKRYRRSQPVPVPVPVPSPATEDERERDRRTSPQQVPEPVSIPVPVPARQVIMDFIRRAVQAGLDADRAVAQFLQQHPDLVYVIAGAGIAIFLATIAEDIATLGAGIADDPATMALAWALFRGAMRYAR